MEHKHHRASTGRTVLCQQIRLHLHMHVLLQGERWAWWTHTENSTSGLDEMEDFGSEPSQYRQEIAMLEDTRCSGRGRVPRCLVVNKSPGCCAIQNSAGLAVRCGQNGVAAMDLTEMLNEVEENVLATVMEKLRCALPQVRVLLYLRE